MNEPTKIDFRYRRISQIDDLTDLVAMLFPGNKNQQHAAARILMALRAATQPVPSLANLDFLVRTPFAQVCESLAGWKVKALGGA